MTAARLVLLASLCLAPGFAAYTYDYASLLNPYNGGNWSATGTNSVSTNFYTSSASNGGSLLFGPGLPSPSNSYEVRTTLTLTASGGHYITYLRASSGSLLGTGVGTFYAVEVANPTFSGGSCSATLNIYKRTGSASNPVSSGGISCSNGMVIRAVVVNFNVVAVYINNVFWTSWGWGDNSPITAGEPGVGVSGAPSSNAISTIDIGHQDTVAPNPLNSSAIGTSSFPTHVDIQFPGDVDDPVGTGIAYYQFFRCTGTNCGVSWLAMTTEPEFVDTTVQPNTTYTYEVQANDFHYNSATIYITVTTPPSGAIDSRQIGVRPLGTYWGGAGEQIDMRSANLNYTVPLIKAMARGGWSVGFSLSYNSENWRQDPGGTWNLGRDIGYGYGWKMQAGSLTPVYSGYLTFDHYLFIDSTGAEYRLNVNNGGVWSSTEGIYVYYDSNAGKLHFRDGSFWVLGSLSAGTEQDAGTMYPTLIEDSNGNQITLAYNAGDGVSWGNSSSRIATITDVRTAPSATYTFIYNSDSIPHLGSISNHVQTSENYTFGYISNYTLTSPFIGGTSYGTYTLLDCANSVTIPGSTMFAYDGEAIANCQNVSGGSGPGELTQMDTPGGGHLRWTYGSFTYIGNRTLRDINGRYLQMSLTSPELSYGIWFINNDPNLPFHTNSAIDDPDGNGEKAYAFYSTAGQPSYALLLLLENRPHHYQSGPGVPGAHSEYYYYTTNSSNNPYINEDQIVEDNYNSTSESKQINQTVDQYGNLTQMQIYGYGPPGGGSGSLARTYTNTYQTNSNYTSRYIFNRLLTSTLTDGTHTTTLASNTYDGSGYADVPNITAHDSSYNTSFTYRGNVSQNVTPSGTKAITYDIGGNVTSTTANGVYTTVATNSTTNWAAPSQLTTNSLSSSMNWTSFLGLSSATGPNGDTASLSYTSSERPTSSTSPTGAVTSYTYVDGISPSVTATTNGHWVKTIKDGFGRTVETDTGYGTTTVSIVKTNYISCGCSPIGKMNQTSEPYAPGGSPIYTTYNYDGLGRTASVLGPDGSVTSYSYSGNTVTVTDPSGRWKKFTMDAFGNLTQASEPSTANGATPPNGLPVFSPGPGGYTTGQTVAITSSTIGGSIRYTTDGSTPSETNGTLYTSPIAVSATTTLKAIAYGAGLADSAVATAPYTIGSGGGNNPPWYNSGWTNRKPVTISHTQVSGSSNLTNFPVLFSVTDVNLKTVANGGSVGKSDGTDILFTASDGVTKLNHELETYNGSTGQVIAWVQVPSLSPTADTTIYVYYGNSSASNQQNPTGVWDSNYVGVWHLADAATSTSHDSTSNANNGTNSSLSSGTGQIDGAATTSGTSYVSVPDNSGLHPASITVSFWLKSTQTGNVVIFEKDGNSGFSVQRGVDADPNHGVKMNVGNYNTDIATANKTADSDGTWHYYVLTYGGVNTGNAYLDGADNSGNNSLTSTPSYSAGSLYTGSRGGTYGFIGTLDEVRLSNSVRSQDWVKTEYNNQSAPGTFLSEGTQENYSAGGSSQVIAVTFNPPPGVYSLGQLVSMSTTTTGATIRYTTDGSTPSETNGTVYAGPIAVGANATLNAIAYKSGMTDSPVTAAPYTIQNSWGGTSYVTTYTYDMLNHLTGVSMPRSSGTQTRTFNYTSGTTVGALLLSATNPENGTVTYTYDTNKRLATKTDAKGQAFNYTYDSYNRLTQISVGSTVLRTYVYDSNPDDSYFSQNGLGRLVEIKYPAIAESWPSTCQASTSTVFTDMFSYTQAGQVAGKRLRVGVTCSVVTAVGDLNLAYSYNNEGKVTGVTYPTDSNNNTPTFSYTYDSMMRLSSMTDNSNYAQPVVNSIQYNAASQLTAINYYGATETRAYNNLMQLTNITATGLNVTYNYTPGGNSGKITSATDSISGETVVYQYDALNRLISAQGNGWAQTQAYDGFGNLTSRVGYGTAQSTSISTPVNAATNQLSGYTYDANGNLISTGYTYDAENRISYANADGVQYFYDAQNKRIWQATCVPGYCTPGSGWVINTATVNLFGADGKQVSSYTPSVSFGTQTVTFGTAAVRSYFGGRLVGQYLPVNGIYKAVVQDRLGSVGKYYPYGEERNAPQLPNDQVKFATYTRDSATGNDYADQRYYTSVLGRFMTPDPYAGSGGPTDPGSWNRYTYTSGDPINRVDPTGREFFEDPGYCDVGDGLLDCTPGGPGYCDPSEGAGFCDIPCGPGTYFDAETGFCLGVPGIEVQRRPTPAQIPSELRLVDTCYYPNGTSISSGYTLEVEYQVLDQFGNPIYGNSTLNSLGVVVNENVVTTSGPTIRGGGVWCPVGGSCSTAGSMTSSGMFWDVLAGDPNGQTSTANQTFLINGTALPVISFSGSPTTLQNSYSTTKVTVNGISATRECGTKNGDPEP